MVLERAEPDDDGQPDAHRRGRLDALAPRRGRPLDRRLAEALEAPAEGEAHEQEPAPADEHTGDDVGEPVDAEQGTRRRHGDG